MFVDRALDARFGGGLDHIRIQPCPPLLSVGGLAVLYVNDFGNDQGLWGARAVRGRVPAGQSVFHSAILSLPNSNEG